MRVFADPLNTLPRLINVINEFGRLAGFHLNQKKSKILRKNMLTKRINQLRGLTECEIEDKAKYLGIVITSKNLDLFRNNYKKLWGTLDISFKTWQKLNLSFFGRIV